MAEGLTALARNVQGRLADRSGVKQGENIAAALVNVHDRARNARSRIRAAQRYREALRTEQLTVGVLSPGDRDACGTARTTVRRVATQLLSDEGKRHGLLTSPSVQEALAAAERAWKSVVARGNQALEAEQERLCPDNLDQPIPELPGATLKVVQLRRHQQRLTGRIGQLPEKILELPPGDEARELRELREAAEKWSELLAEIHEALEKQSPEVRRFIEAASSEAGAPLSLLTPGISAWLERENATDNFVIKTG